ncbi:MAG: hypothetical protein V9F03_07345 [Microthrixaceae bacterium]
MQTTSGITERFGSVVFGGGTTVVPGGREVVVDVAGPSGLSGSSGLRGSSVESGSPKPSSGSGSNSEVVVVLDVRRAEVVVVGAMTVTCLLARITAGQGDHTHKSGDNDNQGDEHPDDPCCSRRRSSRRRSPRHPTRRNRTRRNRWGRYGGGGLVDPCGEP